MSDTKVLIVGAGPVGLTTAIELARRGVAVRVIDKVGQRPLPESRATGHHARTFEHWERYADGAIAKEIFDRGFQLNAISAYANGRRMGRASMDILRKETNYPFLTMFPQAETERLLIEHLETFGVKVERPVELVDFRQDSSHVHCQLSDESGTAEELRVDYLLGCDGGKSTVRKKLGLEFNGVEIRGAFLVDCRVEWLDGGMEDGAQNYLSPGKDLIFWQNPDNWTRVVVSLPRTDPRMVVAPPTIEMMQAFVDEEGVRARLSDPRWATSFLVSNRLVEQFRVGRAFLVGDSAHIHDPTGGQGMNTGVLDAINVAWKIDLALKGIGGEALLDSYHQERYPNVEIMLKFIERLAKSLTVKGKGQAALRSRLMEGVFMSFERTINAGAVAVAGFLINYRKSPIVEENRRSRTRTLMAIPREGFGPAVGNHVYFKRGQALGKRAHDVQNLLTTGTDGPRRLHQVLGDDQRGWLFIFPGFGAVTPERKKELYKVAARLQGFYPEALTVKVVDFPPNKPSDLSIIDSRYDFSQLFGAKGEAVYLVRPDGYVGYKSYPVNERKLDRYLSRVYARSIVGEPISKLASAPTPSKKSRAKTNARQT
jgi:2-polyprenyl-6-methoxyphenol hydroxylase-like FAD-dependent oxidoreductase